MLATTDFDFPFASTVAGNPDLETMRRAARLTTERGR